MAVALKRVELSQGDVDLVAIDFSPYLDAGEALNGVPTAQEVDQDEAPVVGGDLALTGVGINVATLIILDQQVAPGLAVQFQIAGQQRAAGQYDVLVTATTDGGRTKVVLVPVVVV